MEFENATQAVSAAIRSIFERWTALKLIIEHQMAGIPDEAIKLMEMTVSMATSSSKRHDEDDFVDLFYDAFDQMQSDVEDGSPEEIASQVVRVRDAAAKGDFTLAVQLVSKAHLTNTGSQAQSVNGGEAFVEHSEDDQYESELPHPSASVQEPSVDDNGFTEVSKSGRHR